MSSIQVSQLGWKLPSGDELFRDISFSVGNGDRVALIGANGVGKSTLLRVLTGDTKATAGTTSIDGRVGVMRQLVGMGGAGDDEPTDVRSLMLSLSPTVSATPPCISSSPNPISKPTRCDMPRRSAPGATRAATTSRCGGTRRVAAPSATDFSDIADRPLRTLSGGEQKRLALEYLLRGEDDILVLDEPDNFLDVPAKRWLERELNNTQKTVLFVSHDRELLAASATKIVTIEASGAWSHGGGFATYAEAKVGHAEKRERDTRPVRQREEAARGLRRADAPTRQDQ